MTDHLSRKFEGTSARDAATPATPGDPHAIRAAEPARPEATAPVAVGPDAVAPESHLPDIPSASPSPRDDDASRTPIVRRIQQELRERIRSGDLAPGEKLASMRKLSEEFRCSLGIVKQAVNTMVAQGHLRSSPRKGVYVSSDAPAEREIVLVLPHLEIARLHVGLLGVREALEGTGHRISIHAGGGPGESAGPLPEYLTSSQVAGVLVM
ncbi:MAG: winged helix-turn-helix domain-containing protein, partial [Planctomycetota bacterium]